MLRRIAELALSAYLWLLGLYYLPLGWMPVPIAIHRVLHFYVVNSALSGSRAFDAITAALSILALLSLVRRMVVGLPLSLAAISSLVLPWPASALSVWIPCLASLAIVWRAGHGKVIAMSFGVTSLAISLLGLYPVAMHFASGLLPDPALRALTIFRTFWSACAWISIALLGVSAIAWGAAMAFRMRKLLDSIKSLVKPLIEPLREERRDSYSCPRRALVVSMMLGSAIALCIVLLPHTPTVDPVREPISVDTFYYMKFLNYARIHSLAEALRAFHAMARPLYLLAVYGIVHVVPPKLFLDIIQPAITSVALVAVCTLMAARFGGPRAALYSALLVGGGRQVLTFVAGGFQANALALPIALATALVSRFTAYTTLLSVAALIHPWTALFVGASMAFLAWFRSGLRDACKRLAAVAIAVGASSLVDQLVGYTSVPHAIASVMTRASPNPVLNLFRGVAIWTWSTLLNPPTQLVSSLCFVPTPIAAMLALLSPLTLVNSLVVYRALLDTPLEVQASIALARLDKILAVSMVISSIVYTLTIEIGLTPLTGPVWESIARSS